MLEPPVPDLSGGFTTEVRRVVMSKSFETIYDDKILSMAVSDSHPLWPVVPVNGKRMTFAREIVLVDRNRDERVCVAEAFNTTHQTLVLIRDVGRRTRSGIVLPRVSGWQ